MLTSVPNQTFWKLSARYFITPSCLARTLSQLLWRYRPWIYIHTPSETVQRLMSWLFSVVVFLVLIVRYRCPVLCAELPTLEYMAAVDVWSSRFVCQRCTPTVLTYPCGDAPKPHERPHRSADCDVLLCCRLVCLIWHGLLQSSCVSYYDIIVNFQYQVHYCLFVFPCYILPLQSPELLERALWVWPCAHGLSRANMFIVIVIIAKCCV